MLACHQTNKSPGGGDAATGDMISLDTWQTHLTLLTRVSHAGFSDVKELGL
jgi:hypothetical protein